ncbi:19448_t:CDS:2 [Rhizophagus irregularis]|nr:19448_t:CDS:2 [Rhizophagus irregularis]
MDSHDEKIEGITKAKEIKEIEVFDSDVTWQGEPLDRLEIKNLVNTLDELSQAKKDDLMPEISNYTIDTLPYEPLLSLKEGYKTHKKGDHQKAWKCYGYYLFECINGEIDKEKGINLLKESADAGIKDAQFRYAFVLREKESFDSKNEFVKYPTLAVVWIIHDII